MLSKWELNDYLKLEYKSSFPLTWEFTKHKEATFSARYLPATEHRMQGQWGPVEVTGAGPQSKG